MKCQYKFLMYIGIRICLFRKAKGMSSVITDRSGLLFGVTKNVLELYTQRCCLQNTVNVLKAIELFPFKWFIILCQINFPSRKKKRTIQWSSFPGVIFGSPGSFRNMDARPTPRDSDSISNFQNCSGDSNLLQGSEPLNNL